MRNYQNELEGRVRRLFNLYLDSYGYRDAKRLAVNLTFQCDVTQRQLETELKKKSGSKQS